MWPRWRLASVGIAAICVTACARGGNERMFVELTEDGRKYCQSISFPQGWQYPLKDRSGRVYYTPISDFEFRQMSSGPVFMVGGIFITTPPFLPYDPTKKFRIDLSGATPVVTSIEDAVWNDGIKVPLVRKTIFTDRGTVQPSDQAIFKAKVFPKTGPLWDDVSGDATRLSPDESWLVLQSHTRENPGRAYFDIFTTETGKKLLTVEGKYVAAFPSTVMHRTFWLTERYFMIPFGEDLESMVICDFGR